MYNTAQHPLTLLQPDHHC